MHEYNYDQALIKIKAITKRWSNRALSLPGKITIVNSLLASILTYKIMALSTPSQEFFKQYKMIVTDFLWDGKPARIRYNKLIQSYEKGG